MPDSSRWTILVALALLAPALAGCIGDDTAPDTGTDDADRAPAANATPAWAKPLPETITGVEQLTTLGPDDGLDSGYQLALEGSIAYIAAWNAGFYTVDISEPTEPRVLGHLSEHFGHDAWLLHYDNRTVVALAGSGDGIGFIDVTDPTQPELLSTILGQSGTTDTEGANVHNIAVVPGTHLIYNSRSVDTPGVDIVDASDPENPEIVEVFNDLTCHDIAFHMPDERAFCAGVRETQLWDVSDPRSPEITTRIVNPAINIHHWAIPAGDGDVLVIGDEFLGASVPTANACLAGIDNPATGATTTDPIGALWFYDISDPTTPVPVSYVGAQQLHAETGACTAHFGEIVPGHAKMVVGFLSGGVYTLDFGDLANPRMIDHDPVGEVVDVKVHHGYLFGVGRGRGMDVWGFTSE